MIFAANPVHASLLPASALRSTMLQSLVANDMRSGANGLRSHLWKELGCMAVYTLEAQSAMTRLMGFYDLDAAARQQVHSGDFIESFARDVTWIHCPQMSGACAQPTPTIPAPIQSAWNLRKPDITLHMSSFSSPLPLQSPISNNNSPYLSRCGRPVTPDLALSSPCSSVSSARSSFLYLSPRRPHTRPTFVFPYADALYSPDTPSCSSFDETPFSTSSGCETSYFDGFDMRVFEDEDIEFVPLSPGRLTSSGVFEAPSYAIDYSGVWCGLDNEEPCRQQTPTAVIRQKSKSLRHAVESAMKRVSRVF